MRMLQSKGRGITKILRKASACLDLVLKIPPLTVFGELWGSHFAMEPCTAGENLGLPWPQTPIVRIKQLRNREGKSIVYNLGPWNWVFLATFINLFAYSFPQLI